MGKENTYKVVVVPHSNWNTNSHPKNNDGLNKNQGKSQLINRLTGENFEEQHHPTPFAQHAFFHPEAHPKVGLQYLEIGTRQKAPKDSIVFSNTNLILYCIDSSSDYNEQEIVANIRAFNENYNPSQAPIFLVFTKSDLAKEEIKSIKNQDNLWEGVYYTSAKNNIGIDLLQKDIEKKLTSNLLHFNYFEPKNFNQLYYPHATLGKGRHHKNPVSFAKFPNINKGYEDLQGDKLKTAILIQFKHELETAKSEGDQALENTIEALKKSPEYKVLQTHQGVFSKWMGRETSSVKAFQSLVQECLESQKTISP